jgi:ribosomal protein L19E
MKTVKFQTPTPVIQIKIIKKISTIIKNVLNKKGQSVRRLVGDGLIIRKPVAIHSRARTRKNAEARRKGRHAGYGKRKGTANARMPEKVSLYTQIVLSHDDFEKRKKPYFYCLLGSLDASHKSFEKITLQIP